MAAPHLPTDAWLALLRHGRAGSSIMPADVRPVAAATLADFANAMLRGMAPQQPEKKDQDNG